VSKSCQAIAESSSFLYLLENSAFLQILMLRQKMANYRSIPKLGLDSKSDNPLLRQQVQSLTDIVGFSLDLPENTKIF